MIQIIILVIGAAQSENHVRKDLTRLKPGLELQYNVFFL